jgi:micrococcal nuclease
LRFIQDRFVKWVLIGTALVIVLMIIIQMGIYGPKPISSSKKGAGELVHLSDQRKNLPPRGPFKIVRVIDGDTIVLNNGKTIRLIGVDAPEIHHPEIPVQRFGQEAKEFMKKIAQGEECYLEYEPDNLYDQYGRLLAYVFVGDILLNAEIIRMGYAYAYTRFPFRRQDEFLSLEQEARRKQYGLWNLSLRDGRIANLISRYESLNLEGRKRLDEILMKLVKEYPRASPSPEEAKR